LIQCHHVFAIIKTKNATGVILDSESDTMPRRTLIIAVSMK